MEQYYKKIGPPVNGIQEYELKDALTKKPTHIVRVPTENKDKFEKLIDKASEKAPQAGTTKEEIEQKTKTRLKTGGAVGALLGLTTGLLLITNKPTSKKVLLTSILSLGGLFLGLLANILSFSTLQGLYFIDKAMKLSVESSVISDEKKILAE